MINRIVQIDHKTYEVHIDYSGKIPKEKYIEIICSNCDEYKTCDNWAKGKYTGNSAGCEEFRVNHDKTKV